MAINVTGQRIDKGSNYRPWITFRDLTREQGLDFLELLEIDRQIFFFSVCSFLYAYYMQ